MNKQSTFIEHLNKNRKSQASQVSMTIRVTEEEEAKIQDLADYYNLTRQELMYQAIEFAILPAWDNIRNQNNYEIDTKIESNENQNNLFYLLNTCKVHDVDDHKRMLREGIAAAFEDGYKEKIDSIKPNSTVFLYESGKGIVAYGKADAIVVKDEHYGIADKTHYRKLHEFKVLEQPISFKEMNKILDRTLIPLQTLIRMKDGEKILDYLKNRSK
ncbi:MULTISPECIES: hypothetical protein [unclassified Moraxella]|uniref:hypothetical protein n=1 Tax=unclassified Moraxella TaxID=2685852 RepID=UPI003AF897B3